MGTNNINFRYLIEGTFTHINGLPLADGTIVNAYWCNDRVVFKTNGNEYDLPFSNLMNVCIKTNGEILNQYEAGNTSEATAFNEIGTLLSDKANTDKTTPYLIFTYKSKDGQSTKYVALEINQFNNSTANKIVDYFVNLPQSAPKPTPPIQPTVAPTITETPQTPVQQPVKPKKKKHGCLVTIIIFVIICAVIGIVGSNAGNSESAKAKTQIEALVNQPLSDAMTKVDELGYTAKYYYDNGKDNNDYTSYVEETLSNDKKQMKKWVITRYKDINKDDKTVTLFINTKENVSSQKQVQEEASALENKLGHIEACQAAEEYGKKQYPYGFKLHYMSGMYGYAVSGKNKDTWKIKCTATITKAYNASQEVDCEFKVTGTNESPEIVSFDVY